MLDRDNRYVTGVEGIVELALKEPTFTHLSQTGLNARFRLQAPPGAYRLRTVFEHEGDGKLSTATQPIEIPPAAAPRENR